MRRRESGGFFRRLVFLFILGAVISVALAFFRIGPEPTIVTEPGLPGIGKRTPITIKVTEPKRGLSSVRVELLQGDRVDLLAEKSYTPIDYWKFWGDRTDTDEIVVEVGSEVQQGLKEGPATIRVVAGRAGSWLRSPDPVQQDLPLAVKLRPPLLQVMSTRTIVTQGGAEAVVYRVGESSVKDGVQAGEWWFPGYPMPGNDKQQRFALFSAPYDSDDASTIRLISIDDVGNESQSHFIDRFKAKPFKTDSIPLSDGFINRVVPAIMSQTPNLTDTGNILDNYLLINNELRQRNAQTLIELAEASVPRFLWDQKFIPMRNAQVMSDFADRRTYMYNGRAVDRQDHLGFDLASVRNAEIPAANSGILVLARYFGIYGNAVVIDHGHGLMSLYGHLSSISVTEGQEVQRGDTIGRSGETGLAGGDHLHFTILLQGLAVNPREWWDGHWIQDRVALKLGAALPFKD